MGRRDGRTGRTGVTMLFRYSSNTRGHKNCLISTLHAVELVLNEYVLRSNQ